MTNLKKQVTSMIKRGNFAGALQLAHSSVDQEPSSAERWGILSHAQEIVGDIEGAIRSSSKAVELADGEPAHRFQRGWLYLLVDDAESALHDMTAVLALGQSLNNDYYAEMAAFLAAESLRRLRRYEEALQQCSSVSDGFSVYVGMPLSKSVLEKTCHRAIRHTVSLAA
jgi:tetratricopeptide (TPR) repeat protein